MDRLQAMLDEWWKTEPFGFDNSDTYRGILKLMQEACKLGLRARDEVIAKYSDCVDKYNAAADRVLALQSERDAAQAQLQDARALLAEAVTLINHGARLMTVDQVSMWTGVRGFLESVPDFALSAERMPREAHIPEREESAAKPPETRQNSRAGRKDGGGDA